MPNTVANILVFDSGVGGLSIVEHIRHLRPSAKLHYLADNALLPYGQQKEQTLIYRIRDLITEFVSLNPVDMIVIACNSASTLALPTLREHMNTPIVGVVPAIKPAAKKSNNKVIGLLATQGTVNREYTNQLIADFAKGCEVIRVGSTELVSLIEKKMRGEKPADQAFSDILKPLREHNGWTSLDTVVLACTHFPLALKELSAAAPEVTYWIDSGEAIARRVNELLDHSPLSSNTLSIVETAFFTRIKDVNPYLQERLKEFGFNHLKSWP